MMMNKNKTVLSLAVAVLFAGCLPARLAKYRKNNSRNSLEPSGGVDSSYSGSSSTASPASAAAPSGPRASIYAIDKRTFRFTIKENDVWNSALNVLLRNYNVTIVDQQSGIITTEWDSYYLNDSVFRNKLSLRVSPTGRSTVDVTIHNNVERLRDASQAAGAVGAVWLPADDEAGEVARIVQNMALLLNQPPPILPPGMAIAKDAIGDVPVNK